jgi:hypothetical protein
MLIVCRTARECGKKSNAKFIIVKTAPGSSSAAVFFWLVFPTENRVAQEKNARRVKAGTTQDRAKRRWNPEGVLHAMAQHTCCDHAYRLRVWQMIQV